MSAASSSSKPAKKLKDAATKLIQRRRKDKMMAAMLGTSNDPINLKKQGQYELDSFVDPLTREVRVRRFIADEKMPEDPLKRKYREKRNNRKIAHAISHGELGLGLEDFHYETNIYKEQKGPGAKMPMDYDNYLSGLAFYGKNIDGVTDSSRMIGRNRLSDLTARRKVNSRKVKGSGRRLIKRRHSR